MRRLPAAGRAPSQAPPQCSGDAPSRCTPCGKLGHAASVIGRYQPQIARNRRHSSLYKHGIFKYGLCWLTDAGAEHCTFGYGAAGAPDAIAVAAALQNARDADGKIVTWPLRPAPLAPRLPIGLPPSYAAAPSCAPQVLPSMPRLGCRCRCRCPAFPAAVCAFCLAWHCGAQAALPTQVPLGFPVASLAQNLAGDPAECIQSSCRG